MSINNQESSLIKAKGQTKGTKKERGEDGKNKKDYRDREKKAREGRTENKKKDRSGANYEEPAKRKGTKKLVKRQWQKTTQRELRKKKDRTKKQRGRGNRTKDQRRGEAKSRIANFSLLPESQQQT